MTNESRRQSLYRQRHVCRALEARENNTGFENPTSSSLTQPQLKTPASDWAFDSVRPVPRAIEEFSIRREAAHRAHRRRSTGGSGASYGGYN
ncbi:uncharacterized protein N7515_008584 [Penicillium bovifimosum]|uniref:Uncharacterized protein n=1 Tax=Penicillium bovifimosum TaxID=126998 RepID=A0A9W9GNK4_9EURO|nr:uncharacterized protein N7515_008584 [Penicillium bovifimosum]KAJ5124759.1 hypothetical protein N7515_008584 [Penicillium bovifimosum]